MDNSNHCDGTTLQLSLEEFDNLVRLANSGDEEALRQLRHYLDDHPIIWQRLGDLAQHVQIKLVRLLAGENKLLAESIERKADQLRREMLGSSPTMLESLAVERVIACWLETEFLKAKHPGDAGGNLPLARFIDQAKSAAERRYDSAVRSLLLVKEKMPALRQADLCIVRDGNRHSDSTSPKRASA